MTKRYFLYLLIVVSSIEELRKINRMKEQTIILTAAVMTFFLIGSVLSNAPAAYAKTSHKSQGNTSTPSNQTSSNNNGNSSAPSLSNPALSLSNPALNNLQPPG